MSPAERLYQDIIDFLARGTLRGSAEGPQDLSQLPPAAPDWNNTTNVSHACNAFLPACTLGKGEMSIPPLLAQHLSANYKVIAEFCLAESASNRSRTRADLLVMDKAWKPLAVLEFKHYDVHQGNASALLAAMDVDYDDRGHNRVVHWPGGGDSLGCLSIGPHGIPLIQIGLLTAIHSPYRFPIYAHPHPAGLFRYIEKPNLSDWSSALAGSTISPRAARALVRYKAFGPDVHAWYSTAVAKYPFGNWGWGPQEFYSLPGGTGPDFPVIGRVGYVCVMTK